MGKSLGMRPLNRFTLKVLVLCLLTGSLMVLDSYSFLSPGLAQAPLVSFSSFTFERVLIQDREDEFEDRLDLWYPAHGCLSKTSARKCLNTPWRL